MNSITLIKVASMVDLKTGKIGVKANSKDVLIVNLYGKYYAIGNKCTHLGCKLSDGTLKKESIECPCHGSIFDVKTGKVINGPAKKPEPTFKIKIKENEILVDI